MFLLYAVGDSSDANPEFAWDRVLFFTLLLASGALLAIGCSGDAVRNVLFLAISKPFFLGDIVHVHPATSAGGMGESVAGFVECITFSHVVIRAFDCKQVWLAHSHFESLTISNWTRRPNKTVLLKLTVRPTEAPEAVQALLKFIKGWVHASPDVKQSGYQKIALTGVDPGYTLTVIFSTAVGSSKKKMREKLLFGIMEAARRLGIELMPNEIAVFLPGTVGASTEPSKERQQSLAELLPKAAPGNQPGVKEHASKDAAPIAAPPATETPATSETKVRLTPADIGVELVAGGR